MEFTTSFINKCFIIKIFVKVIKKGKNILKIDIPMSHMIVGCVEMPGNIADYYINEKKN